MTGSCFNHFLTPLLIFLTFTTHITSTSAARPVSRQTNNIEFIKTSCSSTTYPRLCYTTLATHASAIQTSSLLLAHTALSVTLNNTQSTSAMMTRLLLQSHHGLSHREVAALHDCLEELSDSVDQLRKSLGEMGRLEGKNFDLTMNDIQTWVSAAMTNEDTCTEGFFESRNVVGGGVKNVVRGRVVNIAHLTSNALALVNNLASTHG